MKIRKRPMLGKSSRYIKYDPVTKSYELRTPGAVAFWPQTFRERLIRDFCYYISGMHKADYEAYQRYMEKERWTLNGSQIRFIIMYLTHDTGRRIPINLLLSSKRSQVLLLENSNPIMRSLLTYSYITDEEIGGLPTLKLLDKGPILSVEAARIKR